MINEKFKLPSFDEYFQYKQRIEEQVLQLESQLQSNQAHLDLATKTYVEAFSSGNDISGTRQTMHELKAENERLNHDLQLLRDSNLKKSQLAKDIYYQYRELEKSVMREREEIFQKSVAIKEKAKEDIAKLHEEYDALGTSFRQEATNKQLGAILDCLSDAFNEGTMQSIASEVNNGPILGVSFTQIS